MSNENILHLPSDLKQRREVLEDELRSVVIELTNKGIKEDFLKLFEEFGIKEKVVKVEWDFYGEYDDEGGTDWVPTDIEILTEDGEIDTEQYKVERKSSWSEEIYEYSMNDDIYELMYEYKRDLYQHDITEIEFD